PGRDGGGEPAEGRWLVALIQVALVKGQAVHGDPAGGVAADHMITWQPDDPPDEVERRIAGLLFDDHVAALDVGRIGYHDLVAGPDRVGHALRWRSEEPRGRGGCRQTNYHGQHAEPRKDPESGLAGSPCRWPAAFRHGKDHIGIYLLQSGSGHGAAL